jgi:hypothetical protein
MLFDFPLRVNQQLPFYYLHLLEQMLEVIRLKGGGLEPDGGSYLWSRRRINIGAHSSLATRPSISDRPSRYGS